MGKINASRVALGGLVAGVIFFIGDGVVNGVILKPGWSDALKVVGLSADDAFHNPVYFASYDLLKGLFAIWIYSAVRPRLGAGPKTALIAALTVWALILPIPMLGLLPMRFLPAGFVVAWSILALIPIVAGGWLYREGV